MSTSVAACNPHGWIDNDLSGHRIKTRYGYIIIRCPEHPKCLPNGYILEHRLVMENKLKRHLTNEEVVHHINGDRSDNRSENLDLYTNSEHMRHHMGELDKETLRKRAEPLVKSNKARSIPRKIVACACGCGQTFETPTRHYARDKKYISGHNYPKGRGVQKVGNNVR